MDNVHYYLVMLVALIAGVILIKKVASCVFRIVVTVIVIAVLVWALRYLGYL